MPAASSFLPLWDRAAEWRLRLAMIREAQHFLYLSTFYIEWDTYGQTLVGALADAQRRGVHVTLLVDSFGQRLGGVLMTPDQRQSLTNALDALRASGGTSCPISSGPGRSTELSSCPGEIMFTRIFRSA